MVSFKNIDISIQPLNGTFNLIVNTDIVFKRIETFIEWKLEISFWEQDKITKDDFIGSMNEPNYIIIKPELPGEEITPEEITIHKRIPYTFTKSQLNKDFGDEEIYAKLKIYPIESVSLIAEGRSYNASTWEIIPIFW